MVITLLLHPTPSSMEGINLVPLSNWIFASQLGQLNGFLCMRKRGKLQCLGFKGLSLSWESRNLPLDLAFKRDGIVGWAFNLLLSAIFPFSKMEIIKFSCRSVGKINELMFVEVL